MLAMSALVTAAPVAPGPAPFLKPDDGKCIGDYLDCNICNNTLYLDPAGSHELPIGFMDEHTFTCPNARGANWKQLSQGSGYDYAVPGTKQGASYLQAARGTHVVMSQSTNGVTSNPDQTLFCHSLRNPGTNPDGSQITPTRQNAAVPRIYSDKNTKIYSMTGLSYMQFNTDPTWMGLGSASKDDGKIACGMCLQLFGEVTGIDRETGALQNGGAVVQIDELGYDVIVMVADQCYDGFSDGSKTEVEKRNCGSGHLDLDVFDPATNANAGKTWWKAVPCPVTLQGDDGSEYTVPIEAGFKQGDVLTNNHDGSYFIQFLTYSSMYPIQSMSYVADDGTKHEMGYGASAGWYLGNVDLGTPPHRFELTSVEDETIECHLDAEYYYPKQRGGKLNAVANGTARAIDDDGHVSPLNCQFGGTYDYPPSPPPSPVTPGGTCVQDFQQCGGVVDSKPWAGPTECCNPTQECIKKNDYYSGCNTPTSV